LGQGTDERNGKIKGKVDLDVAFIVERGRGGRSTSFNNVG